MRWAEDRTLAVWLRWHTAELSAAASSAGWVSYSGVAIMYSPIAVSAASSGIATAVSLGLAGAAAAGVIGGAFTTAQQTEVNKVEQNVKQRLQNPQCAKVLGGLKKAMALFNKANVLHADTINPAFGGSGGVFKGVARQAYNIAKNAKSNTLAWSEIGGKYVYLNDRFFTYFPGSSKEETVFIHELHRLGGYSLKSDKPDYANITKGCGTLDPYVP